MSKITTARKPSTGPIILEEDNPWEAALVAKNKEYIERLSSVQHMHPEMQCYSESDSFLKYNLTLDLLTNKTLPEISTLREEYRTKFGRVMSDSAFDRAFDRAYNVIDDYITTGGKDCVNARTGEDRPLLAQPDSTEAVGEEIMGI